MKFLTIIAKFVLALSACITVHAGDKPLNILFILTDDQAADTIAALGNTRVATPSIDRLARGGMSFTHVFNQGSWSPAVCAPSRPVKQGIKRKQN
jgi:choline-sulfatase|tara:strand:+ start:22476 stop:22760 length:285 start_codon:yes stop_codon:yes gene_type:complete